MLTSLLLIPGFALLIAGASLLVSGASALARRFGVSDLVIGLTIVAFGTSAPELVVSVFAAAKGNTAIAVGNVLGSNTFNVLVILGLSALIRPLAVGSGTVWKEIPLSFLAAVMVAILGNDALIDGTGPSALTRIDGLVLLSFFVVFLWYIFSLMKGGRPAGQTPAGRPLTAIRASAPIVLGLMALNVGAKLAVDGAVALATAAGVSQMVIGLTIVAAGTSLPELATSALAAYKGNADLAVGNIVGSNIFNILFILGIGAVIRPLPLGGAAQLDVAATAFSSMLLFAWMFVGRKPHFLDRREGAICILLYAAYVIYRLLRG